MQLNKRHILLLEVLIAFSIVVMCIFPMLQPFLFMLTEERRFMREVELDRLVGNIYADLLVNGFYRGGVEWRMIDSKQDYPIENPMLTELGFIGSYSFKIEKKKGESPKEVFKLFLLKISYEFKPITGGEPLKYAYKLFVQREKEVEETPPAEEGEQEEPAPQKQQPNNQQKQKAS